MSNITGGRINQKLRTRDALVEVAADLLRTGEPFTVNDVADLARIGRTTAYRYFPTVDSLILQATVHAINSVGEKNLERSFESVDLPEDRLQLVMKTAESGLHEHERLYRTMLRLSLGDGADDLPGSIQRSQLRQQMIGMAISGLKKTLGPKRHKMLAAALNVYVGIEAHIVLLDVEDMDAEQASQVKLWATRLLLRGALEEAEHARLQRAAPKPTRASTKESRLSEAKHAPD